MAPSKSEDHKWQEKYYNALDEIEQLETSVKENDALFSRALIRLSLAAKGFNKGLDPYLLRLRNQLKEGVSDKRLHKELAQFNEALLRFEDGKAREVIQDASLLFEFLVSQEKSITRVSALNLLRGQYDAGKIGSSKDLLKLLRDICAPETLEVDQPEGSLSPFEANLDVGFVAQQLVQLVQDLDMPEHLLAEAKQVIALLQAKQTEASLQSNIEAALSLLHNIKQNTQQEKKEMEIFLAQVMQQLTNLGKSAKVVSDTTERVFVKRNNLDQTVEVQMQVLQQNSANATTLEPLKALIKQELDNISRQMKAHQEEERIQQEAAKQQLAQLNGELEAMKKETASLKENLKQASTQAVTDALTHLPNRIAYDRRFLAEYARWHRNKTPLSLLIWDIDFFKKINDTYGHKAGDKTLMIIAKLLDKYCRETDFVSRFGGEEFTMLLSDTKQQDALILAEKIRRIIEKTGFNSAGSAINITISCGIAELQEGDTQESLFERADQALYQAKKNGRNQCVVA